MAVALPGDNARRRDSSVACLLEAVAAVHPEAVALAAPGRAPLTHGRLYRHVREVCQTLNTLGVGRNDRVALVVPSAPDMAAAFVAVAASATCAPLNPAYRTSEFDFYLSSLRAKALILQAGIDSPAGVAARERGIPVITLTPDPAAEAGIFTLSDGTPRKCRDDGFARPDDVALLLHTSGTTSRPKRVPLTHANICASARTIGAALALTPRDRCLNIMPLYHIHGMIGATLSTLAAGGTLICPPGFNAGDFFSWLKEFRPSWYSAVPTLHQAVLAQAGEHTTIIRRNPLRFIRSCSAPLPPRVMEELERVFSVPVIEAYGMTEAAHQIASNPLPPGVRKAGSVGVATGCEIAVADEAGVPLPAGAAGEILVRGPSVTAGYEDGASLDGPPPFVNGWLRTGDQGLLDPEGYLFIKGRLKEIINRGGTKISPREVEDVLLDHPAIAQAAAFGIPHSALGEDVAAAVVLRPGADATEAAIRRFAAVRLADFKVPCRVLHVTDIPKGPTGKLQRAHLAQQLGSLLKREHAEPRTALEQELARLWAEVLRLERVGIHDNFFEIGGTSLTAARLFADVYRLTGRSLPPATLLHAPTIEELAQVLSRDAPEAWPSLVAIQPEGSRPPFFCVHNVGGDVLSYRVLAQLLGPDQPFYGLQQRGLDGAQPLDTQIEDMAAHYIRELTTVQPEGPYYVGGHSFGGLVAYEVARQLYAQNRTVAVLALIDTYFPDTLNAGRSLLGRLIFHLGSLGELKGRDRLHYALGRAGSLTRRLKSRISRLARVHRVGNGSDPLPAPAAADPYPSSAAVEKIVKLNGRLAEEFTVRPYAGRVAVFLTRPRDYTRGPLKHRDPRVPRLITGGVEVHEVPGDHGTIMREPHVRILAEQLRACLDAVMPRAPDPVNTRGS